MEKKKYATTTDQDKNRSSDAADHLSKTKCKEREVGCYLSTTTCKGREVGFKPTSYSKIEIEKTFKLLMLENGLYLISSFQLAKQSNCNYLEYLMYSLNSFLLCKGLCL